MHDLSLQEIASQFFLSREYVSRRFKQVFHENQSEYLERVRIENAKILLTNQQYKIAFIAEMVGYPDSRYFSKIFSKLTGMTPREWRKKAGGEDGGE
ncbi:HTH-type transcriptional regulator YesS [compost metagenome]